MYDKNVKSECIQTKLHRIANEIINLQNLPESGRLPYFGGNCNSVSTATGFVTRIS